MTTGKPCKTLSEVKDEVVKAFRKIYFYFQYCFMTITNIFIQYF